MGSNPIEAGWKIEFILKETRLVVWLAPTPRRTAIPFNLPRGPEYGCPPTGPRADTIPKPGDVNRDGRPDWDYPGNVRVPGTNKVVGVFGLDLGPPGAVAIGEPPYYPDEYRLGIGTDLDGDGQLDPNEVEVWIGKCPFIEGVNEWWLEYINGVWYVHAVSEDPHTGRKRHYIYNTQTGMLKVFVEGGTMVYFGPATEYTGFGPVGSG